MEKIKLIILENDSTYANVLARQIVFLSKEFSVSVKKGAELQRGELEGRGILLEGDTESTTNPSLRRQSRGEKEERGRSFGKSEPSAKAGTQPGGELSSAEKKAGYSAESEEGPVRNVTESTQEDEVVPEAEAQAGSQWITLRLMRGSRGASPGNGCVPRYGRVSELVSSLLITYASAAGRVRCAINYSGKTKLVGFVSGAGGTGKTAAALAFCRILSREQALKTLYLSFEGLDAISIYMKPQQTGHFMDDFLYYLYSRTESAVAGYLEAFLFRDECGVYSFYPSRAGNELLLLTKDELAIFFNCLLNYGAFDRIVLDFPVFFQEQILFLLKSCAAVAVISDGSFYSEKRCGELISLMEKNGVREECLFPAQTEWDEANIKEGDNGISVSIHHRLGREMKELAEQMEL